MEKENFNWPLKIFCLIVFILILKWASDYGESNRRPDSIRYPGSYENVDIAPFTSPN
jgi:hypothetical protein